MDFVAGDVVMAHYEVLVLLYKMIHATRFLVSALQGATSLRFPMSVLGKSDRRPQASVKEKPVLGILNHPLKAFPKILSGQCTASDNRPFVRFNSIQLQPLRALALR
jgi:hypothetical protein